MNATWDFVVGKTIDERTFLARINERERYRFRPKQAPNADGSVVMMCPAAGPSPIAKCPLKADSFNKAGTGAATVVFIGRKPGHEARTDMGGDRPNDNGSKRHDFVPATREEAAGFRGCRQTSITVPRAVGAKHRQPLAYKSTKWEQIYHPLRATVESMNGRAKNDFNNDIEKASRRRIRGFAAQSVLIAMMIHAVNLAQIESFEQRAVEDADGVARRKAVTGGRRQKRKQDRERLRVEAERVAAKRAGPEPEAA